MDDMEAYQKRADAQLKEWNARIDLLKAKAEQAYAKAYIERVCQIQAAIVAKFAQSLKGDNSAKLN